MTSLLWCFKGSKELEKVQSAKKILRYIFTLILDVEAVAFAYVFFHEFAYPLEVFQEPKQLHFAFQCYQTVFFDPRNGQNLAEFDPLWLNYLKHNLEIGLQMLFLDFCFDCGDDFLMGLEYISGGLFGRHSMVDGIDLKRAFKYIIII